MPEIITAPGEFKADTGRDIVTISWEADESWDDCAGCEAQPPSFGDNAGPTHDGDRDPMDPTGAPGEWKNPTPLSWPAKFASEGGVDYSFGINGGRPNPFTITQTNGTCGPSCTPQDPCEYTVAVKFYITASAEGEYTAGTFPTTPLPRHEWSGGNSDTNTPDGPPVVTYNAGTNRTTITWSFVVSRTFTKACGVDWSEELKLSEMKIDVGLSEIPGTLQSTDYVMSVAGFCGECGAAANEVQVQYRFAGSGDAWTEFATVPTSITAINVQGLYPKTAYEFRVKAAGAAGESGFAFTSTITPDVYNPMIQFDQFTIHQALDALETSVGNAPILRLYSGTIPASTAAAITGTLLAQGTLPADWMNGATSGSKNLLGLWQPVGLAGAGAGTLCTHFRLFESTGTTARWQGTAGGTVAIPTTASTSANGNVLTFASANGITAGMRVIGTNVPAGTRVLATTSTTVTCSHAMPAGISSGATITFNFDLTIDNPTIANGQLITVSSFTLTTLNG